MQWENVHIFISSTFNDMHAERDYLVKSVFPALSEWCEERRLRLIDIDLRWGVTAADSEAKNTVGACLRNIDECRPFFLCFLGQRRGWVPSADDIGQDSYRLFPRLSQKHYASETSVTEMEIIHALIDPLHGGSLHGTKDDSRSGEAVEHAFFYLRDPEYLNHLPHPDLRAIYTNDAERDPATADNELSRWREQEIPGTGRPVHAYTADWRLDESSPEIALPLCVPTTAPRDSDAWRNAFLGWKNRWAAAGVDVGEDGEDGEDGELKGAELEQAQAYNAALTKGRLGGFRIAGRSLADLVIEQLKDAIAARYPQHMTAYEPTPLQREIDQQAQFLRLASEGFIERVGDFDALNEYLQSSESRPFALTAHAGMGKTSLLAHFIDNYRPRNGKRDGKREGERERERERESLHYRFIGGSDGSVNAEALLRSMLLELKQAEKIAGDIPAGSADMMNKLPELLTEAGSKGKTILVIDALNQLESGMRDLYWIAPVLPENIKLVVSFKLGEDSADEYYRQQETSAAMLLHSVKPFDSQSDRRALVSAYLEQYFKELDEPRIRALIESKGAENPLFLKAALSELRVFGVHNDLSELIRTRFGHTPASAFQAILERMEGDPAYTELRPAVALPRLLGWLAHSRYGLSVEEFADLLLRENLAASKTAALDCIYLILRQLRPFLAKRGGRVDFFYDSFRTAATERYTGVHPAAQNAAAWHKSLAQYFEGLPFFNDKDGAREHPNKRKASELAYQLSLCDQDAFIELAATFDWMDAVQRAFGADCLLRELDSLPSNAPKWLFEVREQIARAVPVLCADTLAAITLIGNRDAASLADVMKSSRVSMGAVFWKLLQDPRESPREYLAESIFYRFGDGEDGEGDDGGSAAGSADGGDGSAAGRAADTNKGLQRFLSEAVRSKSRPWLKARFKRRDVGRTDALVDTIRIPQPPQYIRVTDDGKRAVISRMGAVDLWDLENKRVLRTFSLPKGLLGEIYISQDAKAVVCTAIDIALQSYVYYWDADSGKLLFSVDLPGHECSAQNLSGYNTLFFSVDHIPFLYHPNAEKLVCLNDCVSGRTSAEEKAAAEKLRNINLDYCLFDDARETMPFKLYRLFAGSVAVGPVYSNHAEKNLIIAHTELDNTIEFLQRTTAGNEAYFSHSFDSNLTSLALSNDGRIAACNLVNGSVAVFDVEQKRLSGMILSTDGNPISLDFDDKGQRLYVTMNNSTVAVYETAKLESVSRPPEHHAQYVVRGGVRRLPNGNIASFGMDGHIKYWDADTGRCVFSPPKAEGQAEGQPELFCVSTDGRHLAYAIGQVCNVASYPGLDTEWAVPLEGIKPYRLCYTGQTLFVVSADGVLWACQPARSLFKKPKLRKLSIGSAKACAYLHGNGSTVVASGSGEKCGEVHIFDAAGRPLDLRRIEALQNILALLMLEDGRMVHFKFGGIDLLGPNGDFERRIGSLFAEQLVDVALSPDEKYLAAACDDMVIRVWRLDGGDGGGAGNGNGGGGDDDGDDDGYGNGNGNGGGDDDGDGNGNGNGGGDGFVCAFSGRIMFTGIDFTADSRGIVAGDQSGRLTFFSIENDS